MRGTGKLLRYLTGVTDLSAKVIPGQPLLEIYSNRRVLIEHHCGVMEYQTDMICVRMRYGVLVIKGKQLELAKMAGDQLVITGIVESIGL